MLEFSKKEQELITEMSDHQNLQIVIDADNKAVVCDHKTNPLMILGGEADVTLEKLFNYMGVKVKRDKNLRVLRR